MRMFVVSIVTGLAIGLSGSARADDRWDVQGTADDSSATENQLVHGMLQVAHDLAGPSSPTLPTDQDWFLIAATARHSYEGRVHGSNIMWEGGGCGVCPRFDRVNAAGAIQTAGTVPPTDSDALPNYATTLSVRWISAVDETTYLRAQGRIMSAETATDLYDVDFLDTTYFAPRWNNSGGQLTVFLIQNATAATVTGNVFFYSNAGALVSTQAVSVPPFGLQVINTSGVVALAGQSGSATIAHTGGWGALSGKAVALEPSTGFSFDTPFTNLPR